LATRIEKKPIDKLHAFIAEKKLDGVLLRTRRNFSWITGGKNNHIVNTTELGVADLIVFQDKKVCVTTKMESARILDEELSGLGYEFITPDWYEGHDLAIMKLCQGKAVGTDVPFSDFVDIGDEIAPLRYTLSENEIARYRWLSQKSAKAVEATCREIEPGMTEHEIMSLLAPKVLKDGINPQVILVSTDDRIYRYRHPIPTNKKLEKYAMIVICAEKWGLVTNVTRFVHFGKPPKEIEENKKKLVSIDIAMNTATRPGIAIKDVFRIGIETYDQVGHTDDWRFLHQGGPTGYAPREFLAGPQSPGVVQVNQAFAWNPAICGIKSEDTLLVREEGNEFLTYTGEWVYIEVQKDGKTYLRPDILIR
jgi:Xaa-Pro dipeptidase